MEDNNDPTEAMLASTGTANSSSSGSGETFVSRLRALFNPRGYSAVPNDKIKPYQELIISPKLYKRSVNCLRFAIFVDAIAGTIEQPNYRKCLPYTLMYWYRVFMCISYVQIIIYYMCQSSHNISYITNNITAIMVLPRGSPGAHEDSFPSTDPFGFSAATYFVPMTALLGVAIASLVIGKLSDIKGRKPCLLLCLYGSTIGCILKFIARKSFWFYNAMNLLNGLFSASVPVALAYAGDVNETKREKDAEIGMLVGISMLGSAGGGIIAILMETQGLFVPLLIGSALTLVAAVLNTFMLIEPKDILASRSREREEMGLLIDDEDEDDDNTAPTELNYKVFGNIIIGALGDNIGSSGLMPLCLSPLAFNTFYESFVKAGEDPIMPQVAYKWISVLVALMVVPGTLLSPPVYNNIGLAGGCILGNIITGIVTIALVNLWFQYEVSSTLTLLALI